MIGGDDQKPTLEISGPFKKASAEPACRRGGAPAPFSIRLTFEERAILEREAGRQPLGAYIRSKLLSGDRRGRRARRRPVADDQALGKLLGELGKARLANNLNQLAKAVHTGSLPVTPETEKVILSACGDVRWMRQALVKALGLGTE